MSTGELPAQIELSAKGDFASGLLLELIAALRRTQQGDLIAVTAPSARVAAEIEQWSRLTGCSIVERTGAEGALRVVLRNGEAPADATDAEAADRPIGSRLWLYTNFDCNLACDYCCVRSSPAAPRRALGVERAARIAAEAAALGVVREIFVTGGEPLVLPDLGAIVAACAEVAPTTVLTNAMLLRGSRLEAIRKLPRDRVALQVSLDSPTPVLHDLHRGAGTWRAAWEGVQRAREEGFRVRLAATVPDEPAAAAFAAFLDAHAIPPEDRVIRRVARRGLAQEGIALSRADLVPEVTFADDGVYWHPVGAADDDFLVTRELFPVRAAIDAVVEAYAIERAHHGTIASVFHCA